MIFFSDSLSGALDAVMESHYQKGTRVETPELGISYKAPEDSGFFHGSLDNPV
jgi:hypothetical protein